MEKQFIGIDVSHQKLDIAWQQAGKWHHQQVVNDAESIAAWRDDLVANAASKEGAEKSATDSKTTIYHIVVEATGTYSSKIIYALTEELPQEHTHAPRLQLTVLNPAQSHAFARMRHQISKTDRSDARLLYLYGRTNDPDLPLYQAPALQTVQKKQLLKTIHQLVKEKGQIANQQHAYKQLPPQLQQPIIVQCYHTRLAQVEAQIAALSTALAQLQQTASPDCAPQPSQEKALEKDEMSIKKLIMSIKGVGEKTATQLLVHLPMLQSLTSAK